MALRPVDGLQGLVKGEQAPPGAQFRGKAGGHLGSEQVDGLLPDASGHLLAQPFGERVDRQNPAEGQRVGTLIGGQRLPLGQQFHLGMMHLALQAEASDLPGEDPGAAKRQAFGQPLLAIVEPFEGDPPALIADDDFEHPPTGTLGDDFPGCKDLAGKHLVAPVAQPPDRAKFAAVLVAVRQRVEEVLNRQDAKFFEFFSNTGADAPETGNGSGKQLAGTIQGS